jgi:hypothetical protein
MSFFKDKKSLRSHKTVEIQVFLNIFALHWKDPDPPNPTDPVLEHWSKLISRSFLDSAIDEKNKKKFLKKQTCTLRI